MNISMSRKHIRIDTMQETELSIALWLDKHSMLQLSLMIVERNDVELA